MGVVEPEMARASRSKRRCARRSRQVLRQDLDRDRAVEPRIARAIDFAHPAGAEGSQDLVRPEECARIQCQ